jgi:hypothetical protein
MSQPIRSWGSHAGFRIDLNKQQRFLRPLEKHFRQVSRLHMQQFLRRNRKCFGQLEAMTAILDFKWHKKIQHFLRTRRETIVAVSLEAEEKENVKS